MQDLLKYGKHKKYGEWVEQVFSNIYTDSHEVTAFYAKAQAAIEAKEDRDYIEQEAVRLFILALYEFYFFQVLMYKSENEYDADIVLQRANVTLRAMTVSCNDNDVPARVCTQLIQGWNRGLSGTSPEFMVTESLMANFDFSYSSGRDRVAFRQANITFFQKLREKRIIPALEEFFGLNDAEVAAVLHSTSYGFGRDGLYDGKA